MIDFNKLPDYIAEDVARNMRFDLSKEEDKREFIKILQRASVRDVFNRYLTWQGLLGHWAQKFMDALDGIRAAEIKKQDQDEPGEDK